MHSALAAHASDRFNTLARAQGWASFCDPSLAFSEIRFRVLLSRWHDFSIGDRVPCRGDFTPRTLKALLREVAIYERVTNGCVRYRVRLMGTAFAEVMGDLSGKFLDEALPAGFASHWQAALNAVFEAQAPLRFMGRSDTGHKSFLVAEYFAAPLLADDGSLSMALAAGHFAPREWDDVVTSEAKRATARAAAAA
jgi:hypothetical protein